MKHMKDLNIEDIILELFKQLSDDEIEYLKSVDTDELISLHSSTGRSIRNEYDLWNYKWEPELDNQYIDHSPYHPDAISMKIIEGVHRKVNEK